MNSKISILIACLGVWGGTTSCNSFLDTLPDNRTTLNSAEKVRKLNVNAYPTRDYMGFLEPRTDNYGDNGPLLKEGRRLITESYKWEDVSDNNFDSPTKFWDGHSNDILTVNQSIADIDKLSDEPMAQAVLGEALVLRAFLHFRMLNVFASVYNPKTAAQDLGVPYLVHAEKNVTSKFPRNTVKECYEKIEQDLKAGLELIDDNLYKGNSATLKWHFTAQAAQAFAAQFYLYYQKWDEAKKYSTMALGSNPQSILRDLKPIKQFNTATEQTLHFDSYQEPSNLLLLINNSLSSRYYRGKYRYAHQKQICNEQTLRSAGPYGESLGDYSAIIYSYTDNPDAVSWINKYAEAFQITDKRLDIGIPNTLTMPLTTDKTLLVRAEAEILLKEYDLAAQDLSTYYISKGGKAASAQEISDFYNVPDGYESLPNIVDRQRYKRLASGVAKPLHPNFAIEPGMQTNMLQAVLHARRIETIHDGERWFDIRRYDLEITHNIHGGDPIVLKQGDRRKTIQIPASVRLSGLQPNP